MDTNQIYGLVNSVTAQAFGNTALTAVDTAGLVSLGNEVLSSSQNTENFLNVLCQRIGRTVYHYRAYRNKLRNLVLESDMEWGAILQKIDMKMPAAVNDDAYDLVDGQSVDPWVIAKPDVSQKLFVGRNPYMFRITISRKTLKEAFLSESAMGAFITFVFGKIRNKIEASLEELARAAMNTGIAETSASQRINLVTKYNAEMSPATALTPQTALRTPEFLAYAVGQINLYSDYLTDLSVLYNDGTNETFSPKEDQRLTVLSSFERHLETVVQYQAFHDGYVKLNNYETINFWQAAQSPDEILIDRPSDGATTALENVVAVIHDRDAVGVYQMDEEIMTTPVNARGLYYNTFYHILRNQFLDRSENFLVFLLA